jgi:hypothetical protein
MVAASTEIFHQHDLVNRVIDLEVVGTGGLYRSLGGLVNATFSG